MKPNSKLPYILCLLLFTIALVCILLFRHLGNSTIQLSGEDQYTQSVQSADIIISGKININSASVKDLTLLPGIGDVLAERIVDYRQEHGPFRTKEDLLNIKGIGNTTLNSIADYITIGGAS